MQPDRFTTKSQEAVAAAQRLAAERRNPEVAPAHLLMALLDQEDGLVVPVLQKLGADIATIRARTAETVDGLAQLSRSSARSSAPSARRRRWATPTSLPSTCCSLSRTSPPRLRTSFRTG